MRRTSSLVFPLCILKCIGFALTICIVNKHEEGEAKTFPLRSRLISNCSVYGIGKSGTPFLYLFSLDDRFLKFFFFFVFFFYEKRKDKMIFRNFSNLSNKCACYRERRVESRSVAMLQRHVTNSFQWDDGLGEVYIDLQLEFAVHSGTSFREIRETFAVLEHAPLSYKRHSFGRVRQFG